jgi:integrase
MPVVAAALTAPEVARISSPGTHAVGGVTGLCLQVTATGARSWLLRISVDRRRREFGLGAYPTVTLAFARDQARALRQTIGGGVDPSIQRRATAAGIHAAKSRALSFKACAEAFVGAELSAGRNARYLNSTLANLQRIAFPSLGALRVDAVTAEHVLGVIGPIWDKRHATATKVRGSIERVIAFAIANGYREAPNPARWTNNLDKALAAPKGVRGTDHQAALPVDDLPAFMADLRRMPGVAARALEFMVLTAARPIDVREMKWSEVDLVKPAWNIAVDGAKNTGAVAVPLAERAVQILQAIAHGATHPSVFAAPRTGGALSDMALTAVIRRINEQRRQQGKHPWVDADRATAAVVPSGLRMTFRAWASLNKEREAAAVALLTRPPSAQPPGSAARHRQGTEADKRTLLAWARFCDRADHA